MKKMVSSGKFLDDLTSRWEKSLKNLREILYGMTVHEMDLELNIILSIEKWKRSLLREKDLTDFASMDI
jgi:hypothetical protein